MPVRITTARQTDQRVTIETDQGYTTYVHPAYVDYHFHTSHHGVEHARQAAQNWADEIGGFLVDYKKPDVFVVRDEREVGIVYGASVRTLHWFAKRKDATGAKARALLTTKGLLVDA